MAYRLLNAYLNTIIGGSAAGFVYGTAKGLTILDISMSSPVDDFKNGRYATAVMNSAMGAGLGSVVGGFFSMASPILIPLIGWALYKDRKN